MTSRTSRPKKLGSEAVLELFVSKWAIKIVHALTGGARRHGELKKQLGSVSTEDAHSDSARSRNRRPGPTRAPGTTPIQ